MLFPGMATGGLIAAAVVFFVAYGTSKNRLWLKLAILSCVLSVMSLGLDVAEGMKAQKKAQENAIKR
jgi:CDP-diglyceride synthetase